MLSRQERRAWSAQMNRGVRERFSGTEEGGVGVGEGAR